MVPLQHIFLLFLLLWTGYGYKTTTPTTTTATSTTATSTTVSTVPSMLVAIVLGGDPASTVRRVRMASTMHPKPEAYVLSGGTWRAGVLEASALLHAMPERTRRTCLLEVESTNTAENAACGMIRALDAGNDPCTRMSLVVVTNEYHADRTERIFRRVADACGASDAFTSIRIMSAPDPPGTTEWRNALEVQLHGSIEKDVTSAVNGPCGKSLLARIRVVERRRYSCERSGHTQQRLRGGTP